MAFNINSFKSNGLRWGGARPSQFEVILKAPEGIGTSILPRAPFLVKASSLPASTIEPIEIGYFGRKIKLAGDRVFSDWRVTVYNDEDFALKAMFEKWSNEINTHISNRLADNLIQQRYKVDMDVVQYTKDGGPARQYTIVGAYPAQIGEIQLDYDEVNRVEMFDVIFSYDYWAPTRQQSINGGGETDTYNVQMPTDGAAVSEQVSDIFQ